MAKSIVLDEIHLTFRIPNDLPSAHSDELGRLVRAPAFLNRLRRAIRTVVRRCPELNVVRVSLSR
jgi:hypothetical protein